MGSTSGRFNSGREDREGKKRKRERKKKEGYFCLFTAHLTASKQEMNISGKRLQIRNSVIQKADVPGTKASGMEEILSMAKDTTLVFLSDEEGFEDLPNF